MVLRVLDNPGSDVEMDCSLEDLGVDSIVAAELALTVEALVPAHVGFRLDDNLLKAETKLQAIYEVYVLAVL